MRIQCPVASPRVQVEPGRLARCCFPSLASDRHLDDWGLSLPAASRPLVALLRPLGGAFLVRSASVGWPLFLAAGLLPEGKAVLLPLLPPLHAGAPPSAPLDLPVPWAPPSLSAPPTTASLRASRSAVVGYLCGRVVLSARPLPTSGVRARSAGRSPPVFNTLPPFQGRGLDRPGDPPRIFLGETCAGLHGAMGGTIICRTLSSPWTPLGAHPPCPPPAHLLGGSAVLAQSVRPPGSGADPARGRFPMHELLVRCRPRTAPQLLLLRRRRSCEIPNPAPTPASSPTVRRPPPRLIPCMLGSQRRCLSLRLPPRHREHNGRCLLSLVLARRPALVLPSAMPGTPSFLLLEQLPPTPRGTV
mmetsp:Transcript_36413/g.86479  ORF Transcript_36413/g.86479 Transcript_36413/m.86479 type:complete len:359 (+) Transcript_36413:431-1507(+)